MEQIKMNNWEGLKVDKTKIVTPILQNLFCIIYTKFRINPIKTEVYSVRKRFCRIGPRIKNFLIKA